MKWLISVVIFVLVIMIGHYTVFYLSVWVNNKNPLMPSSVILAILSCCFLRIDTDDNNVFTFESSSLSVNKIKINDKYNNDRVRIDNRTTKYRGQHTLSAFFLLTYSQWTLSNAQRVSKGNQTIYHGIFTHLLPVDFYCKLVSRRKTPHKSYPRIGYLTCTYGWRTAAYNYSNNNNLSAGNCVPDEANWSINHTGYVMVIVLVCVYGWSVTSFFSIKRSSLVTPNKFSVSL